MPTGLSELFLCLYLSAEEKKAKELISQKKIVYLWRYNYKSYDTASNYRTNSTGN
jgi:hypothetical protein